jgi:hypothetical protein
MIRDYGLINMLSSIGADGGNVFSVGGTGDRPYILGDFIYARSQNLINSPIGIGLLISILTILAIVIILLRYKRLNERENHWLFITLIWFLFTLYAVNGTRFPIRLSSFRVWPLFAIPVSIIATEGIYYILLIAKGLSSEFKSRKVISGIILILIIIGIWFSSGKQKFELNTANWGAGQAWLLIRDQQGNIKSPELEAYLWLKSLPANTRVFGTNDGAVIGMDKYTCGWCKEVNEFKKELIGKDGNDVYTWLKSNGYEYTILGQQEIVNYGFNETNALLQRIIATQKFQLVKQTETTVVLRVV